MPGDVFVDTSGFFALMVARDPHHARCAELVGDLARRRGLGFTSEVGPLTCACGVVARFVKFTP